MKFSASVASFVALASSGLVAAQTDGFDSITSPTQDQNLTAGSIFNIVWEPSVSGNISITLLQGDGPSSLVLGDSIAKQLDNSVGTYAWTVPSSSYPTYGFKISLDSDPSTFQYSFPFHIIGSSSSSSSSSASAGPAGTSSSASATVQSSSAVSVTSSTGFVTSTAASDSTTSQSVSTVATNGTTLVTTATAVSTGSLGPVATHSAGSTTASSSATASTVPSTNSASSRIVASGMVVAGLLASFGMML